MLSSMFKKTYTLVKETTRDRTPGADIPPGLWRKCNNCGRPIYTEDVKENFYICPKCGGYFRVHAYRRIEMLADAGTFEEWNESLVGGNPLDFPGYEDKLAAAQEKSGLKEAVVTGRLAVDGHPVAVAVMDSRFMMASMGYAVGEKLTRMIERATAERLPVIIFTASGGARMQEGLVSLMQMAKTSAALKAHSEAGGLYITVLTHPTTGGVTASFAMLGDIILAEPGALIGFAGPRVIEQTIGEKLPEGFQTAEFLLEHGFVDRIVPRDRQRQELAALLAAHEKAGEQGGASMKSQEAEPAVRTDGESMQSQHMETAELSGGDGVQPAEAVLSEANVSAAEGKKSFLFSLAESIRAGRQEKQAQAEKQKTAWERVKLSRDSKRPTALDYMETLFDGFMELHGDRCFGDDGAVVGGIAWFEGCPVTLVGIQKGRSVKDNVKRCFGMPHPEGYRKALRLMKQAEKFGRPVIAFVDTPGAYPGKGAEERGQGQAIAENLYELSQLKTPVLSVLVGEGGSGGALALCVADEVWVMENATYSILSPEGFASILYKDASKAALAAEQMKITAGDLKALRIVERVIPEPEPYTAKQLAELKPEFARQITEFLAQYGSKSKEALIAGRAARFRRF